MTHDLPVLYAELPKTTYTDPALFDAESTAVFENNWLIAAPLRELPARGAVPRIVAGRGLVLTRDGEDVRAFYNVCTHRASEVVHGTCDTARMRCPYHGWTYGLDGRLVAVPGKARFGPELDLASAGLRPVHAEVWGAFVWVWLGEDPPTVAAWLDDYAAELSNYRTDGQRVFASRVDRVALNWKATVDAFNETYHVAHIHPQTVGRLVAGTKTWFTYAGVHSRGVIPVEVTLSEAQRQEGATVPGGPEAAAEAGAGTDARTPDRVTMAGKELLPEQAYDHCNYTVFPNVIANLLARWGIVIQFNPIDVDTTELRTWMLADETSSERRERSFEAQWSEFSKVLEEDIQFLGSVGRGLHSRGTDRIRLGGEEARVVRFHQDVADQVVRHRRPAGSL